AARRDLWRGWEACTRRYWSGRIASGGTGRTGTDCRGPALMEDAYTHLIALLDQQGAAYRLIEHESEGRTELVSAMRRNKLEQAAKCIILMVKLGKKITRYVLAVVPGNAKVDLQAVKALMGGTYVAFASTEIAERLA